jgi:hypothetical protein
MTVPAGWYPDPNQQHELRYWDGQQWTHHVADRGVATIDRLGDPSARGPVDASQPKRRWRPLLDVDDHALWWKNRPIPYDSITALAHWVTKVIAGPVVNFTYQITLFTGRKSTKIRFAGRDEALRADYERAVEFLTRHVSARLTAEFLARLAAGDRVEIGGFRLERAQLGFTRRGQVPWSAYRGVRPDPEYSVFEIVAADPRKGEVTLRRIGVGAPNAVLLPGLLRLCFQQFS